MSETSIHNMYSICWWNGDYAWFNSSFWLIHNFDNNLYYDPLTVNHLFIFIMSRVVDENKVQLDLKNFVTDCVIPLNVESKVQRLAWEGVKWENNMIYIFNISLLRTTEIFLYSFIFVYLFPPNPAIRGSHGASLCLCHRGSVVPQQFFRKVVWSLVLSSLGQICSWEHKTIQPKD